MKKLDKQWTIRLGAAALAALCLGSGAALAAGDQNDPLITLSYLNKTALAQVVDQVEERAAARQEELKKSFDSQLALYRQELSAQGGAGSAGSGDAAFTLLTLTSGQTMALDVGCELLLRVGSATVNAATSPALIDTSTGGSINGGASLTPNHLYMSTIPDRTLTATAGTVRLLVRGGYTVS